MALFLPSRTKSTLTQGPPDLCRSLTSSVAHETSLMIVLLSGIHLANISSWRHEVTVRGPLFKLYPTHSRYLPQILSLSLVTPGTRRPLSAAPPQPVQSMHSLYPLMGYTWPHLLARMCTFGQLKHEGYFTRKSCLYLT